MKLSELYCCFSVPLLWPPFCSWLFSHPMLELYQAFSKPLSTAAFASGIFIACGIGINLCTKLWCNTEFCPLPAMCSSWIFFVTDSILCLVDSWASVIQLNLVFAPDALDFSVFETTVSRIDAWGNALLHGIAAAFWCLQLSPCIVNDAFVLFITRINRLNFSQFSGVFEFRFSIAHSCFSLFWAAFPILVQASGHLWSGRDVVWIFVSLRPDHKNPSGGVSFNKVNLVKPVHESDRFLSPSTFQLSSIRFLVLHPKSVWVWPDDINVFQWNREWLFFWHV